jgi:hypothetical protein
LWACPCGATAAAIIIGRWINAGSLGADPRNRHWVDDRCRTQCDPTNEAHGVFAAVARPAETCFPMVWDPESREVPALNITRFYMTPTNITVEIPGGGAGTVTAFWKGDIAAFKRGTNRVELVLAQGESFDIEVATADGKTARSTRALP